MNKVSANQNAERIWQRCLKKLDYPKIIKHYLQENTAILFPAQVPDEHRNSSSAHSNQPCSENE